MYGNNYRPFITPSNMPYNPYNINPGFSHTILNSGGIRNLFRGIHNINWNGMLNNVSRTLGVVRDAIPVVKEVRPMVEIDSMMLDANPFLLNTPAGVYDLREGVKGLRQQRRLGLLCGL